MATHEMGLQQKYFDFIKNGTKRIELRLYDNKRRQIQLGDQIIFTSTNKEQLEADVIGLLRYQSFEELVNDINIDLLVDKSFSARELLDVLEEFYPIEKQKSTGVIGIRIKPRLSK